jgi:hypothetical protein
MFNYITRAKVLLTAFGYVDPELGRNIAHGAIDT